MRSSLAILITLIACNNTDVDRMTAIEKTVCACKTASCAEQAMKRVPETAIKSTHRTQEIARELLDCLARLQAAERPTTDPDDDAVPEPEPESTPSGPRTAAPASAGKR